MNGGPAIDARSRLGAVGPSAMTAAVGLMPFARTFVTLDRAEECKRCSC